MYTYLYAVDDITILRGVQQYCGRVIHTYKYWRSHYLYISVDDDIYYYALIHTYMIIHIILLRHPSIRRNKPQHTTSISAQQTFEEQGIPTLENP